MDTRSLETLTERETAIKEDVNKFRDHLWKEAREIIHSRLPSKVIHLNNYITDKKLFPLSEPFFGGALEPLMVPIAAKKDEANADEPIAKKRKVSEAGDSAAAGSSSANPAVGLGPFGHENMGDLVQTLRSEIVELAEMCNTVKIWIQLNIPRIEDGNNFGVSIQEETVNELGRAEDSALAVLDNLLKFHVSRAKIVSKLIKYPTVKDYEISLAHHDYKQLLTMRLLFVDLRNNYAILHDIIVKNLDKIRKPRSSHHASLY